MKSRPFIIKTVYVRSNNNQMSNTKYVHFTSETKNHSNNSSAPGPWHLSRSQLRSRIGLEQNIIDTAINDWSRA